jgi:hypothetical protein
MANGTLNPEKLRALSSAEIWDLALRTAAAQSRLLSTPADEPRPEDRSLLRLLAEAVLLFERELRRRALQAQLAGGLSVLELDPGLVVELD